jgi:hypothetical protein
VTSGLHPNGSLYPRILVKRNTPHSSTTEEDSCPEGGHFEFTRKAGILMLTVDLQKEGLEQAAGRLSKFGPLLRRNLLSRVSWPDLSSW